MASHSDEIYDFDKILRHKEGRTGTLYYVKWKGYSDKHNSWEPQENFTPQDIEDYMELQKRNLIKRMDEAAKKTMERKQREGQKLAALAEQAKSRAERKRRWDLIKSKPQLSYDSDSSVYVDVE